MASYACASIEIRALKFGYRGPIRSIPFSCEQSDHTQTHTHQNKAIDRLWFIPSIWKCIVLDELRDNHSHSLIGRTKWKKKKTEPNLLNEKKILKFNHMRISRVFVCANLTFHVGQWWSRPRIVTSYHRRKNKKKKKNLMEETRLRPNRNER